MERFEAGLRAAGIDTTTRSLRKGKATYYIWRGDDSEKAKHWLSEQSVPELTCYIVETPDGEWGADVDGLFREKLQAWQLDTGAASCEGVLVTLPDTQAVIDAARGTTDNFLAEVECGRCAATWLDGVRYQDLTAVRCPSCSSLNRVDSSGIAVQRPPSDG